MVNEVQKNPAMQLTFFIVITSLSPLLIFQYEEFIIDLLEQKKDEEDGDKQFKKTSVSV